MSSHTRNIELDHHPIEFLSPPTSIAPFLESSPTLLYCSPETYDFLGVDNYTWVLTPSLMRVVYFLGTTWFRHVGRVGLKISRRAHLYSKYLFLWTGRVQYLTNRPKWDGLTSSHTIEWDGYALQWLTEYHSSIVFFRLGFSFVFLLLFIFSFAFFYLFISVFFYI